MSSPENMPVPPPPPSVSGLQPGQVVGADRYLLKKVLGQGGMAVIWMAFDKRLRETVALKFLPAQIASDPAALDDLRRETLRTRKLSHPNIIRIHDFFEARHELAFISMEYVDGPDLHALRARRPAKILPWNFLAPLVRQLCQALDYAHGERVIHRDLKPANLMLDNNGRLKLADFGLACALHDSMSRISGQPRLGGTLNYMSPQQADGHKPATSDDIYGLGATLYELLTSRPPFYTGDIGYQVRNNRPQPLQERLLELELTNDDIPSEVSALVMACLAKDPEQRPASAQAILDWIDAAEKPQPAAGVTPAERAARPAEKAAPPTTSIAPTLPASPTAPTAAAAPVPSPATPPAQKPESVPPPPAPAPSPLPGSESTAPLAPVTATHRNWLKPAVLTASCLLFLGLGVVGWYWATLRAKKINPPAPSPGEVARVAAANANSTLTALKSHPDTTGWKDLFAADLSNALLAPGEWVIEHGELSAKKRETLWTKDSYANFILDLEFKVTQGANSGVFLRAGDIRNVLSGLEIQVHENTDGRHCGMVGAIYDVQEPSKSMAKPVGEWNRYTVTCKDSQIALIFNGEEVWNVDLNDWKKPRKNPDGTSNKFRKALKDFPRQGPIGLQGIIGSAGSKVWYRNIKIKVLD